MFPNYLDGARVRYYTNEDHFGIVDYNNGEKIIPIHYLAICSYANEQGFYLFFCDEKYNVVSDYFFDTIEECKEIAKKAKKISNGLKNQIVQPNLRLKKLKLYY